MLSDELIDLVDVFKETEHSITVVNYNGFYYLDSCFVEFRTSSQFFSAINIGVVRFGKCQLQFS